MKVSITIVEGEGSAAIELSKNDAERFLEALRQALWYGTKSPNQPEGIEVAGI